MSGQVDNIKVWPEIDVFVGDVGTTPPALPSDVPASPDWTIIGFMDPSGLKQTLEEDSNNLLTYEGIIAAVTGQMTANTFSFSPMEDNDTVRRVLTFEGSPSAVSNGGVTTTAMHTPKRAPHAWLVRLTNGSDIQEWVTPKGQITASSFADIVKDGGSGKDITVTRLAASDGLLFNLREADAASVPAWQATTPYTTGNRVTLTGLEIVEATTDGTSDGTEPTAPAGVGGNVVDATVIWKRIA